jgi:nucleotide-binding universal stress UspA family protein
MYFERGTSILNALEPLEVDLIVMCSHGYTGFKRWELGSIAHKIVHHSLVPVLLLRDGGPTLVDSTVRALVPLDGSPLSETVLRQVVAFITAAAPANQRFLHLMRVVDLPVASGKFGMSTPFDQEVTEDVKREAHQYLAAHAAQLMEDDDELVVTTSVVVNTDVAGALVEQAEQAREPFDLIAMATHGRGGVQRWLMGSVMERVLHRTKLPLLVVPAATHQKHAEERKETVETTR